MKQITFINDLPDTYLLLYGHIIAASSLLPAFKWMGASNVIWCLRIYGEVREDLVSDDGLFIARVVRVRINRSQTMFGMCLR